MASDGLPSLCEGTDRKDMGTSNLLTYLEQKHRQQELAKEQSYIARPRH